MRKRGLIGAVILSAATLWGPVAFAQDTARNAPQQKAQPAKKARG